LEKASWLAYAGQIIFLLNAASGVLIFYLKIGRCVVIRKCYARMSDPASNDKLTLEMLVSDGGRKIFIWDFDKGVAIFSEGITGKQSKYIVQGEKHAGHINLIRDKTVERTIYGVKEFTCGNGDSGKSSPVFCSLCEGQILIIECQKAFIRKPLRLDELTFE
jgi:hypothetical protein